MRKHQHCVSRDSDIILFIFKKDKSDFYMENELESVKQKVKRLTTDNQDFNSNHYDYKDL